MDTYRSLGYRSQRRIYPTCMVGIGSFETAEGLEDLNVFRQ